MNQVIQEQEQEWVSAVVYNIYDEPLCKVYTEEELMKKISFVGCCSVEYH